MRGYYLMVALFGVAMACLLVISQRQANILDSVRAYVAGEGLWSKGQKDAVYHLIRYSLGHDDADYRAFVAEIGVTLGDKQARLALQQPVVDRDRAREGFLKGGNHPDDVEKMIDFFVDYQRVGYVKAAIGAWTDGDAKIAVLTRLGGELHDEIASGAADPSRIAALVRQVDAVNRELTALENRFSETLGEAARWSGQVTRDVVYGAMLLLLGTVLLLSWRIVKGIRQTERALIASEARFRGVVESNMVGILFWQADGTVVDANDAFLQMVGYNREELRSGAINWRRLTPPEHYHADDTALREIREIGICTPYEKELVHGAGHRVAVYIGGALFGGNPEQGASFVLDISKRREAEQMQRLAATVFQAATEGIVVTDGTPLIQAVNPAFTLITGYREEEVIGRNPSFLGSDRQDEEFFRRMWHELTVSDRWRGEIWNRHKDGRVYPEWLSIGAIRDGNNEVVQYVGIFSDISDRKAKEAVVWHQAHYDGLTDLPNRALFHDRLSQQIALAKREQRLVAVMFVDLDHFKRINDSQGHRYGDLILRQVARRLQQSVRETDTVARLSGDEFSIIVPHVHHEQDAVQVARTIIDACVQPCTIEGGEMTVTASIGVAFYPTDASSVDDLLNCADAAMYVAKTEGRNRFRLYVRGDGQRGGADPAE